MYCRYVVLYKLLKKLKKIRGWESLNVYKMSSRGEKSTILKIKNKKSAVALYTAATVPVHTAMPEMPVCSWLSCRLNVPVLARSWSLLWVGALTAPSLS